MTKMAASVQTLLSAIAEKDVDLLREALGAGGDIVRRLEDFTSMKELQTGAKSASTEELRRVSKADLVLQSHSSVHEISSNGAHNGEPAVNGVSNGTNGHSHTTKNGSLGVELNYVRSRSQTLFQLEEAGGSPLHLAASVGFDVGLVELIKAGVDVNLQTPSTGLTPLHVAAMKGQSQVIECLVKKNGAINLQDKFGRTPIYLASRYGHQGAVQALVSAGARLDIPTSHKQELPLHAACIQGHSKVVELLVKSGQSINAQTSEGHAPLHLCALHGHPACARILISRGADANTKDKIGSTPLLKSFDLKHRPTEEQLEIVTMLIKCSALNEQDKTGLALIHYVCHWGEVSLLEDMTKFTFDVGLLDGQGRSGLHHCFLSDRPNTECAKILVKQGCDIAVKDTQKRTALDELMTHEEKSGSEVSQLILDWAKESSTRKSVLHSAVTSGNVKVISDILSAGGDVDTQDEKGNSALHLATMGGKIEIIKLLIRHNASVNLQNKQHQSALHLASTLQYTTCAQTLIDAGASVSMKDEAGMGCLHKAAGWGNLNMVKFFIQQGAVVNELDCRGQRALHMAAEEGKVDVVNFLIDSGAKVSVQDKDGKTPLHLCAKGGHEDVLMLLLDHSAEVNLVDKNSQTPLHVCCFFGRYKCIQALLGYGADLRLCDAQSQRPITIATEMGYSDIVSILEEHKKNANSYSRQSSLNNATVNNASTSARKDGSVRSRQGEPLIRQASETNTATTRSTVDHNEIIAQEPEVERRRNNACACCVVM